jgi:MFS transporter, PAT family, beta-lactamase induction signal transducer AmpG
MIPARKKRYAFRDYLNRRALTMLALGFSSGLPFLLVANTFGFWLRDEGTSLKAIGFLSWVGLAYSLQFVWAPLVDRIPLLRMLGQRRGWMLVSQCFVAAGLFAMAFVGVHYGLLVLCGCALVVGLSAATQDIAINAWRIEIAASEDEQGLLISAYTLSYRIALMCADSLMLIAAQHFGWAAAYTACAIAMGIGIAGSLFAPEPKRGEDVLKRMESEEPLWSLRGFFDAVVGPFIIFFKTYGALALLMLLAISLYRLPDFMRGPIVNPFFHDLGVTKDVIGQARATVGLVSIWLGVATGGFLCLQLGYMRALMLGAVLQSIGIFAQAVLTVNHDVPVFLAAMAIDDFGISVAGVTLVAYMSSLTSLGYTATQYALLSSAYALAGKFLKGFSGLMVEGLTPHFGLMNAYAIFFTGCALIGVPSLALFAFLGDRQPRAA